MRVNVEGEREREGRKKKTNERDPHGGRQIDSLSTFSSSLFSSFCDSCSLGAQMQLSKEREQKRSPVALETPVSEKKSWRRKTLRRRLHSKLTSTHRSRTTMAFLSP